MTLNEYRTLFIAVSMVLILIAASPTLGFVLPFPSGEKFSELWVLGSGHMAEGYPFNVTASETYKVFLGIGNYMASSCYYVVYVKFRNQTESMPNSTAGTPSSLPALYEYRVFIQDGETWEAPLTFSFGQVSFFENRSLVESLAVNDVTFGVDKLASWDLNGTGYYFQLFFELWIYNTESNAFQFHNRAVWLWLNATRSL
jgi:uncharacterized membrane protein